MNIPYDLSPELSAAVQNELERGEVIRWCDRPVPKFFTSTSTIAFIFGIPWSALTFPTMGAMIFSGQIIGIIFLIPFVLIGFGMLSSPIWMRRKMKNTVYLVTDRRAVVFEMGGGLTITTYLPDQIREMTRRERRNGLGDVMFASKSWRDSDRNSQTQELGFFNIQNPRGVEHLIEELRNRQPTPPRNS